MAIPHKNPHKVFTVRFIMMEFLTRKSPGERHLRVKTHRCPKDLSSSISLSLFSLPNVLRATEKLTFIQQSFNDPGAHFPRSSES